MTPSPTSVAEFFQIVFWIAGGLAALLGCVATIAHLARSGKRVPPFEAEFATKEEVGRLDTRIREVESDVSGKIDGLRGALQIMYEKIERSDEARTSGLHNRLNQIAENVAELSGTLREHISKDGGRPA